MYLWLVIFLTIFDNLYLQIMEELNKNDVEIYRFPTDDETVADINNQMNVSDIFKVSICIKVLYNEMGVLVYELI